MKWYRRQKHVVMRWRHYEAPMLEQWGAHTKEAMCAASISRAKTKVDCTNKLLLSISQGYYFIELVDESQKQMKMPYDRLHQVINWYVSNNCLNSTNRHSSNPKT
jgi:hypothetical protein